jgi:ParB-like chromosome segregation protein Spo0J
MTAPLVATTDRPYQLLPPLTVEQRELLRQSIQENGVLEPVVFDEDGEILDGHHRVEIAEELGIEYPRRVIDDLDQPGKHMYALTVNVARRQLDQAARGPLVAQLRIRNMSIRQIADMLGVPKSTVARDVAQLSHSGQLEQPERIKGADGKDRPASRPAPAPKPDLAPTILQSLATADRDGLDLKAIAAAWPEPPSDKDLLRTLAKLTKSGEIVVTRAWANGAPRKWASAAVAGDLTPDVLRVLAEVGAGGALAFRVAFQIDQVARPVERVTEVLHRLAADRLVTIVETVEGGNLWALTELLPTTPGTVGAAQGPPAVPGSNPAPVAAAPADSGTPVPAADGCPTPAVLPQGPDPDPVRTQLVDAARRKARRIVAELSNGIDEIEIGIAYGESGLATAEIVAGLRAQADRLEQYLPKEKA